MGCDLSGNILIGVFYSENSSANIILLSLFRKLFLWNGANGGVMILYSNFQHITTVF